MATRIVLAICMVMMFPGALLAESSYFLGTRSGWKLTEQAFVEGRYKKQKLFIVIGTGPTTDALRTIRGWKSKTTYFQDITDGADTFGEQLSKSASSIPGNCADAGKSVFDLFVDPVKELRDFNLITPVTIVAKTAMNAFRIVWNGTMVIAEPVARVGFGSVALVGAPFLKPATYTGIALMYTGTTLYGYGSSTVAGGVMMAATGTVLALDIATSPVVAAYEAFQPDEKRETVSEDNEDDEEL